jgi:SAM-dependent methyltransferase
MADVNTHPVVARVLTALRPRGGPLPNAATGVEYWRLRAQRLGSFGVLNCSHKRKHEARVTERQRAILLPLLQAELSGSEKVAVDIGCGPGRFTPEIASLLGGHAIGLDPIAEFLTLARQAPNVDYRLMSPGELPLPSDCADVVWLCLVLGGILDRTVLDRTVAEAERVLKPNGLVFLVENTSRKPDGLHWAFRSAEYYDALFSSVRLSVKAHYDDLGETISVLCGRGNRATGV